MRYIECPEIFEGKERSLFLAGGISGCENWQTKLVKLLENTDLTLLNPRRKHFPTDSPNIEEEQITWEHNHLAKTNAVSFWFPKETLCPITLFELGKCLGKGKRVFIGVNPKYLRKKDVEIQTRLVRPGVKIVYSIEELAEQIKEWSMKSLNNILDK